VKVQNKVTDKREVLWKCAIQRRNNFAPKTPRAQNWGGRGVASGPCRTVGQAQKKESTGVDIQVSRMASAGPQEAGIWHVQRLPPAG
jgi:hypothetical protein